MELSSDDNNYSLIEHLQSVNEQRLSGVLRIQMDHEVQLHFLKGECVRVIQPKTKGVGEVLLNLGHVTNEDLDRALHYQKNFAATQTLGSILEAQGKVSVKQIEEAVIFQIEEVIWDALQCDESSYSFVESIETSGNDIRVSLSDSLKPGQASTAFMLFDAVRRFDEEKRDYSEAKKNYLDSQGEIPGDFTLSLLLVMLQELSNVDQGAHLIVDFLNVVSEHVRRGVLFARKNNQDFVSLRGFGTKETYDPGITQSIPKILMSSKDSEILKECERSKSAYFGPVQQEPWLMHLMEGMGKPTKDEIMVLPIWSEGEICAIVYGDNNESSETIHSQKLIQMASWQLGLMLENIDLRKRKKA